MVNTLSSTPSNLQLGSLSFDNPFIQGPLAGISCAPFRRLTWMHSRPAFSCTEMISCKTLLYQAKHSQRRYVSKAKDEGPVCFQLSSNEPKELAEAVQRVTEAGADLIDLNCGCPVDKIRRKQAGSYLLSQPPHVYQLIQAMKNHTHVPVSIKIRVDGGSGDRYNEPLARMINESGVDFVTVHGRHWTEHYETACRHEQIRFFVENVKVPVIGNGDIADSDSLNTMLATGCAGVMIGRAGVGQPWLIGQLKAQRQGIVFHPPADPDIAAMFIQHIHELSELLASEKLAVLQARKMAKYYARSLKQRSAFCAAMHQCEDLAHFQRLCRQYFV